MTKMRESRTEEREQEREEEKEESSSLSPTSPPPSPPSTSLLSLSPPVSETQNQTLIPGLPDDLAALILSSIPISHHQRLRPTCKSWKFFLSTSSETLTSLRRFYRRLTHLLCIFPQDPSLSSPFLFDPQHLAWRPLPPMPINPHVYGLCNFNALSIGSHIFVLGGSLFDTRSFPIDRPSPTSASFRFDLAGWKWIPLSPMLAPRGSFACAALPGSSKIVVAGGGSRHTLFGAAGSRMRSAEMYDVEEDRWFALEAMPRFRAGCVGFFVEKRRGVKSREDMEFWVMGGYGESRIVSGVFPVDEYYRDAVVMKVNDMADGSDDGNWREVGDMWELGERRQLGKIVVVEDEEGETGEPAIFMLDGHDIFRYSIAVNRWLKESSVPRRATDDSYYGFVTLNGELLVMTPFHANISLAIPRSRLHRRSTSLYLQIYHPGKKTWRSLISKPPFHRRLDFRTAVVCTVLV